MTQIGSISIAAADRARQLNILVPPIGRMPVNECAQAQLIQLVRLKPWEVRPQKAVERELKDPVLRITQRLYTTPNTPMGSSHRGRGWLL